jgi:hypothetical protein
VKVSLGDALSDALVVDPSAGAIGGDPLLPYAFLFGCGVELSNSRGSGGHRSCVTANRAGADSLSLDSDSTSEEADAGSVVMSSSVWRCAVGEPWHTPRSHLHLRRARNLPRDCEKRQRIARLQGENPVARQREDGKERHHRIASFPTITPEEHLSLCKVSFGSALPVPLSPKDQKAAEWRS